MNIRRKCLLALAAAMMASTVPVTAATADTAAAVEAPWDEEMWTDDGGRHGGQVLFDRNGDDVMLCDTDSGDGHYVWLKVGKEGRYYWAAPDPQTGGCSVIHGARRGGRYDLPEPGPWQFKICLRRISDLELYGDSCDKASWFS